MTLPHEKYFSGGNFQFTNTDLKRAVPSVRALMLSDLRESEWMLMAVDSDPGKAAELDKVRSAIKTVESVG